MDMRRFHLDKQSATPLYEQLRAQIMDAIRLCELTAGDQLPTEEELCRALDISRPVVQGACKALIRDGYIQRVRGKGTFVRVPDSRGRFINRQLSFQDEMRLLGLPHRTEVLCAEWFPRPVLLRETPQLPGGWWYHLVRLRYVKDQPFVLAENDFPGAYFPDIDRFDYARRSLYDVLKQEYGVRIVHSRRSMTARLPSNETAAHLRIRKTAPVMVVDNIVYDQQERIIDLSREWLEGVTHQFDFDVYNP